MMPPRMKRLPKVVQPVPKSNSPKTTRMPVVMKSRRTFISASSTRMYRLVNMGLMTKAMNSEEDKTMMRVIGRYFINSPMMPGQMAKGRNAANVVAVEAMMGQATSPTP